MALLTMHSLAFISSFCWSFRSVRHGGGRRQHSLHSVVSFRSVPFAVVMVMARREATTSRTRSPTRRQRRSEMRWDVIRRKGRRRFATTAALTDEHEDGAMGSISRGLDDDDNEDGGAHRRARECARALRRRSRARAGSRRPTPRRRRAARRGARPRAASGGLRGRHRSI